MISAELTRFLDAVTRAFDRSPDDLVAAVEGTCHDVLVLAQDDALLRAIVSATHGTDTELLPLLAAHSATLLQTAQTVVAERVAEFDVALDPVQLATGIEVIVRVVLSHDAALGLAGSDRGRPGLGRWARAGRSVAHRSWYCGEGGNVVSSS